MYGAEISLTLFKIIGIWPSENSKYLIIYHFYTIITVSILVAFGVTNSLYILSENFETDELMENCFYSFAVLIDCIKMVVIYQKRDKLQEIAKGLYRIQFEPRDSEEVSIQNKFDNIGRFL